MSNQKKPPLPNAFEQARNTGKIGGSGKRKDPTINPEPQEPINTGIQEIINPERKEPTNQVNLPQKVAQEGKEEEIKKQTIDLPKSLARRVKNHATNRDEKIREVHIRALEKLLKEEGG